MQSLKMNRMALLQPHDEIVPHIPSFPERKGYQTDTFRFTNKSREKNG